MEAPRLHSNRVNAAAFQRAVWRNGLLTSSSIGDTTHDDGAATAPTHSESDGPERQRLDLRSIENRTTELQDEDDFSGSGNGGFFDDGDDDGNESEREYHDGDANSADGSEFDGSDNNHMDLDRRRLGPRSSKNCTHVNEEHVLLKSLFGATIGEVDQQPDESSDDNNDEDCEPTPTPRNRPAMPCEPAYESTHFTTSSTQRQPVCIGCQFAEAIQPVDQFVVEQAPRIPKCNLWPLAAQFYEKQVRDVVHHSTGQRLPAWTAEAIEKHYEFHVIDQTLFRIDALRDLKGMRTMCKDRMVISAPGGAQEVDQSVMKAYMQILSMESREIGLLSVPGLSSDFGAASAAANASKRKR